MPKSRPHMKTVSAGTTYKVIHWALFFIVLGNLFLIWKFEQDRKPKVVHETVTVISNHVYVVTNFLGSSSGSVAGTNGVAEVYKPNDPQFEIELPYRYGLAAGKRYVDIGGRYFSEGSPTSYGIIVRIFPERIALDNGYFIKNENFNNRFRYDRMNERDPDEKADRLLKESLTADPSIVVRQLPDLYKPYERSVYYE